MASPYGVSQVWVMSPHLGEVVAAVLWCMALTPFAAAYASRTLAMHLQAWTAYEVWRQRKRGYSALPRVGAVLLFKSHCVDGALLCCTLVLMPAHY